jgi:hypothetical protein
MTVDGDQLHRRPLRGGAQRKPVLNFFQKSQELTRSVISVPSGV